MPTEFIVVLVTAPSPSEADRIAEALLSAHLAACCNLVSGVRSFFRSLA